MNKFYGDTNNHNGEGAVKGKTRKRRTGCLTQINDHLWEGRDFPKRPDGRSHSRNVYANTSEECGAKLAELICQMKEEIAEAKELTAQGKLGEAMVLATDKNKALKYPRKSSQKRTIAKLRDRF